MNLDTTQLEELRLVCESVSCADEGGFTYVRLQSLKLPAGCAPSLVDALLCPMPRDGYTSRLFFAQRIDAPKAQTWNVFRILEDNWHAFSWRTPVGLRLAQMVAIHLGGLR